MHARTALPRRPASSIACPCMQASSWRGCRWSPCMARCFWPAGRWGARRRRWRWWPWCRQTWSSTSPGGRVFRWVDAQQAWVRSAPPKLVQLPRSGAAAGAGSWVRMPFKPCAHCARPRAQGQARGGGRGARALPQRRGRPPHPAGRVPGIQRGDAQGGGARFLVPLALHQPPGDAQGAGHPHAGETGSSSWGQRAVSLE